MNKKIVVLILSFCLAVLSACAINTSNDLSENDSSQEQTTIDDKKDELDNPNPVNDYNDWLKEQVDEAFYELLEEARNDGATDNDIEILEDMREDVYYGLVRKHLKDSSDEEYREAWKSELHIQMVRNSKPSTYPTIRYKDAFENFFGKPKWVYFEGTKGNSNDIVQIVEFTGDCMYDNEDVKALIQFEITDDGFTPSYLSIDDRSKNQFELNSIIKAVFDTYELDSNKVTPVN